MAGVAFGRFTLIDLHGESLGEVIIAPEYILLQRGAAGPARDVSYLALWSAARLQAIENELAALALTGPAMVTGSAPEVRAILHAIAPAASPLFVSTGRCRRTFARRQLKVELERATARVNPILKRLAN